MVLGKLCTDFSNTVARSQRVPALPSQADASGDPQLSPSLPCSAHPRTPNSKCSGNGARLTESLFSLEQML